MNARKTGDLDALCRKLGYVFKRPELLDEAFRHASFVNEKGATHLSDNERLEFLGDAVLDLAISHICMSLFKDAKEGILSKYRAWVVNERCLSQIGMTLKLGDFLLLGKGEESTEGREKPSILANTVEALFGAIYLDGGFEAAKEIIQRLFGPYLDRIESGDAIEDFKSLLQEYTQEKYRRRPEYRVIAENGPPHDKTFRIALTLNTKVIGQGVGKSKKEAEQRAAKEAFFCLRKDPAGP